MNTASVPLSELAGCLTREWEEPTPGPEFKPIRSTGRLFAVAVPIITRRAAEEYPMPFGKYRGLTVPEIAAKPWGEDYLLWAANTWSAWFVVEVICRCLGICPLRAEPIEASVPDDDFPF